MAEVEIKNLCKSFGKVRAVIDLNLHVKDKEMVSFLGPSGCGKTTSLRMIGGLERPTSGQILLGGKDVTNTPPKDRHIAMVFETYALYPRKTVFENMAFPLRIRKFSNQEIKAKVLEAAKILDIEELLDRGIRQLSGGQRQRVAMGRAIVRNPALFLMDEPLSHLDAKLRTHMRGELKRLQKDLKTTMIYVTHDQLEAMSMADRIAVMNLGVLQQLGTPDQIFNHPVNEFVAGFVGDPPINFIEGNYVEEGDTAFFQNNDFKMDLPEERAAAIREQCPHGSLHLGIRPSYFDLHHEKPDLPSFPAEVFISEPLGEVMIIDFMLGKKIIKAATSPDMRADMGETMWLSFDFSKAHLFDAKTGNAVGPE
ncbi:MAG: ABC transporter ATP-binding protein [Deltaproteobacteria bacterium]|nr:ABC transporter ATP-binding protein [Deltaproteobacteria bacterium]